MSEDITKEVNFYKKNFLKLNAHYRTRKVSSYMVDDDIVECKHNSNLEAYHCLNSPNNFTKLIRENEANDLIVGEGLIKTYPANKALTIVKKFLNDNLHKELYELKMSQTELVKPHDLRIVDLKDEDYSDEKKPLSKMSFVFPFYKDDDLKAFVGKLADKLYVCGYNYANNMTYSVAVQPFAKKIILVSLLFEAKYYEEDFKFAKWLYHVTTFGKLSKIKRFGLVPKSKSSKFDYPDRVYLFNTSTQDTMFDFIETKADGTTTKAVVLKIDSSVLQADNNYKSGKLKLYIDHMFDDTNTNVNALFTYNNLKASLLEDDILVIDVYNGKIAEVEAKKLSDF